MSTRFLSLAAAVAFTMVAAAPPHAFAQAKPPLSPPGTATAKIGAANLSIEYGRPSMRGRKIMGELVPFDKVWRTGANKATHLTTSAEVTIAGVVVPAGTYTLYTLPGATAWKLIINKQTGQWGTQYDAAQDHARVDMKVEKTAAPVEQFTITMSGTGGAGTITLEWEGTKVSVPVTAK
jgi:hypothetical protein